MMKVKYIGSSDMQASFGRCDDPRPHLIKGKIYEVEKREVHKWHTQITLVDFPLLSFNSVSFDESSKV